MAGNERLVLLAIADNADDAGSNAWPSTKTLAHKTRLDVRTVQRVVRRLCEGGHLAVATAAGRGGANLYRVVMDPDHSTTHPVDNPVDRVVDKAVDSGGAPRQDATPANCHPRHPRHHPPGTRAGGPPAQLCHPNVLNVLEPPPPPRATTRPLGAAGPRAAAPARTAGGGRATRRPRPGVAAGRAGGSSSTVRRRRPARSRARRSCGTCSRPTSGLSAPRQMAAVPGRAGRSSVRQRLLAGLGAGAATGAHAGRGSLAACWPPVDLRHAAVSTWLNAGIESTQVAEWAGHSVNVLLRVYAKCIVGRGQGRPTLPRGGLRGWRR